MYKHVRVLSNELRVNELIETKRKSVREHPSHSFDFILQGPITRSFSRDCNKLVDMCDSMQEFQQKFEAFTKQYKDQQYIHNYIEKMRQEGTKNSSGTCEPRVNRHNGEGGKTNRSCKLEFSH